MEQRRELQRLILVQPRKGGNERKASSSGVWSGGRGEDRERKKATAEKFAVSLSIPLEMSAAAVKGVVGGVGVTEGGSTTKTKRFKVKHPKRKLFRASEPLLSVFMWGVNHTVRELQHVDIPVMLMPDDFRAFSKIKVSRERERQWHSFGVQPNVVCLPGGQPRLQQGEPAQPLQGEGVLPPGVQESA